MSNSIDNPNGLIPYNPLLYGHPENTDPRFSDPNWNPASVYQAPQGWQPWYYNDPSGNPGEGQWTTYDPSTLSMSSGGFDISDPRSIAHSLAPVLAGGMLGVGDITASQAAGNAILGRPVSENLGNAAAVDAIGAGLVGGTLAAGAGAAAADPFSGAIPSDTLFSGGPGTVGAGDFAGGAALTNPEAAGGYGGIYGGGSAAGGLGSGLSLGGVGNAAGGALSRFLGGNRGGTPGAPGGGGSGNSFLDFLTGSGGGPSIPSLAPGVAALEYARRQNPIDTSQLQGVFNAAGANAPLFVQAAQDPLRQAQAGGYGDIVRGQGLRGIGGSSFGNQSIANYLTDTNRGIANAGTNAAQAALGLQGELGGQISNLNALSQQMKNNLYGRAFSSLGQGLQPTPGMGFGGGIPGGGTPGGGGGMPNLGGAGGFMNNLGLSGVGNAFGNVLGSVGRGIGNLFGSPGSTFWSGPASPIQGGFNDFTGMWG